MGREKIEPVRMCVSCRERAPKWELARLVAHEGKVLFDEFHQCPGRGVYVHPRRECLVQLRRKGKVAHALRLEDGAYCRQDLVVSLERVVAELIERCPSEPGSSSQAGCGNAKSSPPKMLIW